MAKNDNELDQISTTDKLKAFKTKNQQTSLLLRIIIKCGPGQKTII